MHTRVPALLSRDQKTTFGDQFSPSTLDEIWGSNSDDQAFVANAFTGPSLVFSGLFVL